MTEDMKAAIGSPHAELFAEKGYPHVTMREIAKQAGCSHTAIYLYFKNKEELLQHIAIPSLLELENEFQRGDGQDGSRAARTAHGHLPPLRRLLPEQRQLTYGLVHVRFRTGRRSRSRAGDQRDPQPLVRAYDGSSPPVSSVPRRCRQATERTAD